MSRSAGNFKWHDYLTDQNIAFLVTKKVGSLYEIPSENVFEVCPFELTKIFRNNEEKLV